MLFKYILKKFLVAILLLLFILSLNFLLIRVMPGDPLLNILGEQDYYRLLDKNPDLLEELRVYYGLDGGIFEQYVRYLNDTINFNFGYSYKNDMSVLQEVKLNIKWTIYLLVPNLIIGALVGGYLGLIAGWKQGSRVDRIITPVALLLKTIPGNCLAIIFLIVFSYKLKLFPIGGMVSAGYLSGLSKFCSIVYHMTLPLCVLLLYRIASNFLMMKSTTTQICNEEYTITAFSKGLSEKEVMRKHVLKNALAPYVTSICMQVGGLLGGATFVEIVFSWRGMGSLYFDAMNSRDFPMLQFCFLISGVSVIVFNLMADIFAALIDPRVREGKNHD